MEELPDLRCLRAFHEVARCGSVSAAASRLNVTQSAVSHALRDLQAQIGCQLIYRSGRGVRLTREGSLFYERLGGLLNGLSASLKEISAAKELDRGLLRLGCSETAARVILPPVLREFRESFPRWNVSVIPGRTGALLRALGSGEVDLVLSLAPSSTDGFATRLLFQDELHYVFAPAHRWATGARPTPRQLAQERFILVALEGREFQLIEEAFLKIGAQLRFPLEAGSAEVTLELVKLNLGVSLMAPWMVEAEIRSGALKSLPFAPRIRREWIALSHAHRPLQLAERTFLALCQQAGADFALRHGLL